MFFWLLRLLGKAFIGKKQAEKPYQHVNLVDLDRKLTTEMEAIFTLKMMSQESKDSMRMKAELILLDAARDNLDYAIRH